MVLKRAVRIDLNSASFLMVFANGCVAKSSIAHCQAIERNAFWCLLAFCRAISLPRSIEEARIFWVGARGDNLRTLFRLFLGFLLLLITFLLFFVKAPNCLSAFAQQGLLLVCRKITIALLASCTLPSGKLVHFTGPRSENSV